MLSDKVCASGVKFRHGFRMRVTVRAGGNGYILTFDNETGAPATLTADFLVDATGITASAARRLGIARNQIDCLAVASSVVDLNEPDAVPSQALLEACEHGWWYAARIPRGRMIAALAVGDAACAYDPISAQTIVKALGDGEAAAEAISIFLARADSAPLVAYQDAVFARFRDYLRLHQHLYGLERRWPRAPFGQHRMRLS